MATTRKKYSAIVYPDSAYDINECINYFGVSVVRYAYILHDRDYELNGELKKPHYHLFIEFDKDVASSTFEKVFCTKVHQSVKSMEGCIIYMTHKRNQDKSQYDYKEIVYHNLDVENIVLNCEGAEDSEMQVLIHILSYIKIENVGFRELLEWCLNNGYYYVLRANFSVIKEYLKN